MGAQRRDKGGPSLPAQDLVFQIFISRMIIARRWEMSPRNRKMFMVGGEEVFGALAGQMGGGAPLTVWEGPGWSVCGAEETRPEQVEKEEQRKSPPPAGLG